MITLGGVVTLILALCIIATVIIAFQRYVMIPDPFGWMKGVILFLMVVIACYFLWDHFVAGRTMGFPGRR